MAILRPFRHLAAVAAAIGAIAAAPDAPAPPTIDPSVKAAYLAKFGIFVEWPKAAFDTPQSPVVLCVAGTDPFGESLDRVAAGQHVGEHPIVIRRLPLIARDSGCAILFAGGSDAQSVDQALQAVTGTGVLTVADAGHGGHATAIVEFVVQDGRVRFTIDDKAAAQNGIVVSSHLLDLAVAVKPRT
jgi:YfiR/HmsC-like